jgi:hypothetical protein
MCNTGKELVSLLQIQQVIEDLRERLCIIARHSNCFGLSVYMCSEVCRVYNVLLANSRKSTASLKAYENLALTMAMPYALDSLLDILVSKTVSLYASDSKVPQPVQAHIKTNPMCEIVEVWYSYAEYVCMIRQAIMDEDEICNMMQKSVDLQDLIKKVFPHKSGEQAGWAFHKFHWLGELAAAKVLIGSLDNISTQMGEQAHLPFAKSNHAQTNNKGDVKGQKMKRLLTGEVTRALSQHVNSQAQETADKILKKRKSQRQGYSTAPIFSFPLLPCIMFPEKVQRTFKSKWNSSSKSVLHVPLNSFVGKNNCWKQYHPGMQDFFMRFMGYLSLRWGKLILIFKVSSR